jgi:hypothetical protein
MTLLAIVVSIVAVAFAGALGTAVHDSQARYYAEQTQTRHAVVATTIGDSLTGHMVYSVVITANARWQADGAEHIGEVLLDHPVKAGNSVKIWVDTRGDSVEPPSPASRAGTDAVTAAVFAWLTVIAVMAALVTVVRTCVHRSQNAAWDLELRNLTEGRTNRQP